MKKIINPVANGGAPLAADRLVDVLGGELWTAIESMLAESAFGGISGGAGGVVGGGMIISGCNLTGAGPYNCSAGVVYLNGQFMAFPGFSGQTLPQYIVPATPINIPKPFADGVSRNLIIQQDATFQSSVPGSGNFIPLQLGGYPGFDGPSPAGYRAAFSQLDKIGMGGLQAINITSGVVTTVVSTAGVYFINSACTGGPFAGAQGLLFCIRGNANEKVLIMIDQTGGFWWNVRTGGSYLGWQFYGGKDNAWQTYALSSSNVKNQAAGSPLTAGGTLYWRRSVLETFMTLDLTTTWSVSPTSIIISSVPSIIDTIWGFCSGGTSTVVGSVNFSYWTGTGSTPGVFGQVFRSGSQAWTFTAPAGSWTTATIGMNIILRSN